MRVFIAGIDGYLGWPLALHLADRGHEVGGCDLMLRRKWVREMGSHSAIPIVSMPARVAAFAERFGRELDFRKGDLRNFEFVSKALRDFRPDAVVQLGEMPSAPYSMVDAAHASFTQINNVIGSLNLLFAIREHAPKAHILKLGTMGEYGTPNVDIPEGFFELEFRGRRDRLPFPRQAGSWYHWSKVHGSNNTMFACRIWGLRATDVMQGVVFGTRLPAQGDDARLRTRLDFDQAFGTAINRFCCQAVIGHPLTPFGKGHQKRGFLPLRESIECFTLALENPPAEGEYRVFNQFAEVCDITELAVKVCAAAQDLGLDAEIRNVENPRLELEEHYYNPDHRNLFDLGYKPSLDIDGEIRTMLSDLVPQRRRILAKEHVLLPDVRWDGRRTRVKYLDGTRTTARAAE